MKRIFMGELIRIIDPQSPHFGKIGTLMNNPNSPLMKSGPELRVMFADGTEISIIEGYEVTDFWEKARKELLNDCD